VAAAHRAGAEALYVDVKLETFQGYHPVFDAGAKHQGDIDLASFVLEKTFEAGPDRVVIYSIPR
jgi:hypothetical protein